MKAATLVQLVAVPAVVFGVTVNTITYLDAKNLLKTNGIDTAKTEDAYFARKDESFGWAVTYYVGWPGRQVAYNFDFKEWFFRYKLPPRSSSQAQSP